MISLFYPSIEVQAKIATDDNPSDMTSAINLTNLVYTWNPRMPPVLEIPALTIKQGQRVFIQGPSGSGKSTLLGLLSGIVIPQNGSVAVLGHRLDQMTGVERDRFRANHLGVIFQMFNLIPYLSVVENVTLPCRFSRRRLAQCTRKGDIQSETGRLLQRLGMSDPTMLHRSVTDLSVGQQQRVAAARALLGEPDILIADEPTSSLDRDHRFAFLDLLFEECGRIGSTLIFVSHDTTLAPSFNYTIQLTEINRAGGGTSKLIGEDHKWPS